MSTWQAKCVGGEVLFRPFPARLGEEHIRGHAPLPFAFNFRYPRARLQPPQSVGPKTACGRFWLSTQDKIRMEVSHGSATCSNEWGLDMSLNLPFPPPASLDRRV